MTKHKSKPKPKENERKSDPAAEAKPLVAFPQRKGMLLLAASSVLLGSWMLYLLYVALRA